MRTGQSIYLLCPFPDFVFELDDVRRRRDTDVEPDGQLIRDYIHLKNCL